MSGPEMPQDQLRHLSAEVDVEYWQKEALNLTRVADWEKLRSINTQYDRDIKTQNRKYHHNHDQRFKMACEHIASLRGEKFDKLQRRKDPRSQRLTKMICKAAEHDVETDHHRRLSTIRERHAKELRDLVENARDRDAGPQAPKLLTDGRNNSDRPVRSR